MYAVSTCNPVLALRLRFLTFHPLSQGVVEAPIGRMPYPDVRGGLFAACPPDAPGAKPSRSHYTVLHRDEAAGTTLVDVEIFTGGRDFRTRAG